MKELILQIKNKFFSDKSEEKFNISFKDFLDYCKRNAYMA